MLYLSLVYILICSSLSIALSSLDYRYLCWPSHFTINNLIKDVEITGKNEYQVKSIRKNCDMRYHLVDSNTPNEVKFIKKNSKWIVSFTFFNYSKPYEKLDDSIDLNENSSDILWILYLIIPEAFSCYKCQVSLSLDFGHSNFSTTYKVRYGFIRANFPFFIDYTSKETIKREDKSKFEKINLKLTKENDSLNVFFLDNNFFGNNNQHFLLGISELYSNKSSDHFINNFFSPSVIYHLCYTDKNGYYVPDTTCYAYVKNQNDTRCICWETYNLKEYFMISVVFFSFVPLLAFLLYRHKNPTAVNQVNIYNYDNNSDNSKNYNNLHQSNLTYCVKIFIRLGWIQNHQLPGKLEINLKGKNGTALMDILISCGQTFSSTYLATYDVNELIINVYLDHRFEQPILAEITYFKEIKTEKAETIYLYGFQIETSFYKTIFPYSHYLKSHRQVILSNEQAWHQRISRDYTSAQIPVTIPIVQSLTSFERNLMFIFGFVSVCSNIQMLMNDNPNNVYLIVLESVGSTLFLFGLMFIIYVIFIKKKALDKYFMIKLSISHQFFQIFILLICIGLAERVISLIVQVSQSFWPATKFNHEIASNFSQIIWEKDIHWAIVSILSFLLFCVGSTIFEATFFKLYNPTAIGPIVFEYE